VALAGQTGGAIRVVLDFFVPFLYQDKKGKHNFYKVFRSNEIFIVTFLLAQNRQPRGRLC
jgi:hypothetical protein